MSAHKELTLRRRLRIEGLQEIHLHIPRDFEGIVHLHLGAETNTAVVPDNGPDAGDASAVESMLGRFETFDPTSVARQVYGHLVDTGWKAYVPTARDGSESKNSYLRFVYAGERRVVVYLNTVAIVNAGAKEREFASTINAADVRAKDVYYYFNEGRLQQALHAADRLRQWADRKE